MKKDGEKWRAMRKIMRELRERYEETSQNRENQFYWGEQIFVQREKLEKLQEKVLTSLDMFRHVQTKISQNRK